MAGDLIETRRARAGGNSTNHHQGLAAGCSILCLPYRYQIMPLQHIPAVMRILLPCLLPSIIESLAIIADNQGAEPKAPTSESNPTASRLCFRWPRLRRLRACPGCPSFLAVPQYYALLSHVSHSRFPACECGMGGPAHLFLGQGRKLVQHDGDRDRPSQCNILRLFDGHTTSLGRFLLSFFCPLRPLARHRQLASCATSKLALISRPSTHKKTTAAPIVL